MRRFPVSWLTFLVLATVSVGHAQDTQPDSAMVELENWLTSKLPEYGTFRFAFGTTLVRYKLVDVVMENCLLLYNNSYQSGGAAELLEGRMLQLGSIDPASLEVNRRQASFGDPDRISGGGEVATIYLVEAGDQRYFRVECRSHANEIVERIRDAAVLCAAKEGGDF